MKLLLKISLPVILFILLGIFIIKFYCNRTEFAPSIKKVESISINDINKDSISLNIKITAENKNDFDLDIKDIRVKILKGTDTLGNARCNDNLVLPKKKLAAINFDASLSTPITAKHLSLQEDTLRLILKGKITADLKLVQLPIDFEIPFSFAFRDHFINTIEEKVKNKKIITPLNALVTGLGLSETTVKINFELNNPYGIEFKLTDYPSEIFINGKYAGKGNLDKDIFVKEAGSESPGQVLFKLDNFKSISSLFGSLFTGKLEYETKGNLHINIFDLDIEFPYSFKGVLLKI
ncbi:MAG: LEA type 2 family protein [Ignavibacteriaceae bacterium]|nr:LEA type 2 family protein [Ignavibacteriaceae bacterium]